MQVFHYSNVFVVRTTIRIYIDPVTVVQLWVCESQLVAGGGGVSFGSQWPVKVVPVA